MHCRLHVKFVLFESFHIGSVSTSGWGITLKERESTFRDSRNPYLPIFGRQRRSDDDNQLRLC